MENKRNNLIFGLFGVVLLFLILYCIRDFQRDRQRHTVDRYIDSGQLLKTMTELGWTTNRLQDFSLSIDGRGVLIQVDARTKQEFNRLVLIAAKPGRPSVEHVNIRLVENVSSRR